MRQIQDRVIAVTGAASGLGRSLARALAARGAVLALADRDETGLAGTVRGLDRRRVRTDVLDVRDRDAVQRWADATASAYGVVHGIVNNAGVSLTGRVEDVAYDDLHWVMDVDYWGVVHGTRAFLPHLRDSGDGHVVNVSSVFGLLAVPGQSGYNAAKFAVRGFTESLRQELLADRAPVAVTLVLPGGLRTAIVRNSRTAPNVDRAAVTALFDRRLARTSPERAADRVVAGIEKGRARVLVGPDARVLDVAARVAASGYQRIGAMLSRRTLPTAPRDRSA